MTLFPRPVQINDISNTGDSDAQESSPVLAPTAAIGGAPTSRAYPHRMRRPIDVAQAALPIAPLADWEPPRRFARRACGAGGKIGLQIPPPANALRHTRVSECLGFLVYDFCRVGMAFQRELAHGPEVGAEWCLRWFPLANELERLSGEM